MGSRHSSVDSSAPFHSAAPGSIPIDNIFAFSIYIWIVMKKVENMQKEAGIGPKKTLINNRSHWCSWNEEMKGEIKKVFVVSVRVMNQSSVDKLYCCSCSIVVVVAVLILKWSLALNWSNEEHELKTTFQFHFTLIDTTEAKCG